MDREVLCRGQKIKAGASGQPPRNTTGENVRYFYSQSSKDYKVRKFGSSVAGQGQIKDKKKLKTVRLIFQQC